MNIQDKMQEIHNKYGVTEKANYEIQLFVEALLKEQKEQLILSGVRQSFPKRLSNAAYLNAREMRYEDFVKWCDEKV